MKTFLLNLIFFSTYGFANEFVPANISAELSKFGSSSLVQSFAENSLCFDSAESSFGLGPVRNCVEEFTIGKNSFWLMQQDIKIKTKTIKNLIATYVDLESKTAYYLELNRERFEKEGTFEAIDYKAPCAMCHPSGPRVIRPTVESLKSLSKFDSLKLSKINEKISNYKVIKTHTPKESLAKKLFPNPSQANEILKLPRCYECHNSKTGVRSELTMDQLPSIKYLAFSSKDHIGSIQMPPQQEEALSKEDLACLSDWLNQKMPEKCLKEHDKHHKSENKIEVKVKTSFHEFLVSNLPLTIDEESFSIDLTNLSTGITPRDNHTKDLFGVKNFPKITGIFRLSEEVLKNPTIHNIKLKIKDIEHAAQVLLTCDEIKKFCNLSSKIDLTEWGLVMPSFLGIKVESLVEVNGTIKFKRSSIYQGDSSLRSE